MSSDHTRCDDIFARAEEACTQGDWERGAQLLGDFVTALEAHFASEEDVLFPAFETATGMRSGPTQMMREEHRQMRDLLANMNSALSQRDSANFSGGADTLLVLMQQHNMKEENILYPMCDQALGASDMASVLQQRIGTTNRA
jgi:iron-sulfur cluster repair protein YtfE (RIC family)